MYRTLAVNSNSCLRLFKPYKNKTFGFQKNWMVANSLPYDQLKATFYEYTCSTSSTAQYLY